MHRDVYEEEPRDANYGDLILDNVQRIKDKIYGNGNRRSVSPRSGPWTSSRDEET